MYQKEGGPITVSVFIQFDIIIIKLFNNLVTIIKIIKKKSF